MSGLALLCFAGFGALSLWGVYMGVAGCLTDAPPFMAGEGGKSSRYDKRLKKAA